MSQTAMTEQASLGEAGLLGDSGHDMYIRSYAAEGTDVAYGLGLVPGTDPETQVAVPAATFTTFSGFAVKKHPMEDESASDFADGETVDVLRKGRVWVPAVETMAVGDTVHVIHTGGNEGQIRNDVDGGNADAVAECSVLQFDSDNNLALISVNLP